MIKAIILFIFFVFNIFFIQDLVFASGVVAQRNRPTGAGSPSVGSQPQRPTVQGPPVNLGPRKHSVYAPARKKSVNLPAVLPFEARDEVKNPAPVPEKKEEPAYKSQVLTSSSGRNNSGVAQGASPPPSRKPPSSPPSPEMVAFFNRMDQSSEVWLNLKDPQVKTLIVSHYMELYQQFGVKINKPVDYYINLIDSMAQNNPRMLIQPFDQVLRVVAILEYDYDSGENKDALAASILTDRNAFLKNRQRLGIK